MILPPLTDEQIVKIAREVCDRPIQRQDAIVLARAVIAASLPCCEGRLAADQ